MFKLLKYMRKRDWGAMIIIAIFVVLQVWLEITMLGYTRPLSSELAAQTITMQDVWTNGGFMLLCALGSMIASFICSFFCVRLSNSFSYNLRNIINAKISSFSSNEMKSFSTASLLTRTTNDVMHVQMFISIGFQMMLKAPVQAIWSITEISSTSFEWTMATAIAVVIILAVVGTIVALVLPKLRKAQKLIDNLNGAMRENVSGVRVVRAFNAEDFQEQKFEIANDALTKNQLFTTRTMGLLMPAMTVCMNGLTLAIYWIGAVLINNAAIFERADLIGSMNEFTQLAMRAVMAFIMLIAVFILLPRAMVSARRINEVLDTKPSIIEGNKTADENIKGEVEFKNVSFKYADGSGEVVKDINFKVNKGETIAVIGATGSGKTTLIDLIPRFYDVTSGEVLVDGQNVKDYREEDLNNKIALISQKACLFKGTIKDNLTLGYNGEVADDDERITNALKMAEANFVFDLEKGVNSEVAQGGTNFSGGQKQRLNIARALFKDAEIVIFDDSFSALDYKTDMLVRKNIKQNLKDKTIIIIAQRIGTIKNADKILVLDDGKIAGLGKHEELLKTCPVYKEIALSQLNKEEL